MKRGPKGQKKKDSKLEKKRTRKKTDIEIKGSASFTSFFGEETKPEVGQKNPARGRVA